MFDAAYYERIWGTVHRHDYCRDRAEWLIAKYGKCRILDIGTGCGELVRVLGEMGCDAWGLEVSDYAADLSCAPWHVRRGDVRNIPYAAESFDVVHSQGLWEYVPESDVRAAWKECNRVGRLQEHNYDTTENDDFPEHQIITRKSPQWWKDQFYPKILVACPNFDGKEYCFERWIENVRRFTYPNYDVLVVDNSKGMGFFDRWSGKIPMLHVELPGGVINGPEARINYSMEVIRQRFLSGDYHRWFNLESDIIPPVDIIEKMLLMAQSLDWMAHGYPDRNGDPAIEVQQGVGCCMFSPELMREFNFHHAGDNYTADGWLWGQVRPLNRFKVVECWGMWPIQHLKE